MATSNFEKREYNDILLSILYDASRKGILKENFEEIRDKIAANEPIPSVYAIFLSCYAYELSRLYDDMEGILSFFDIEKASGETLDRIGQLVGLTRRPETYSITKLVFYREEPADEPIEIPQGVKVATEDEYPVVYATMDSAIIASGETQTMVKAMSTIPGSKSRVGAGALTHMVDPVDGVSGVYNPDPSTGGYDAETDGEFRRRIREWPYNQQKGTEAAYRQVLDMLPGLNDYRIIGLWDGPGTALIVIDPPEVVEEAKQNIETAKALDEDVTVRGVELVDVNVDCVVNISIDEKTPATAAEKSNVEVEVEKAIRTYIDGGVRADGSFYSGMKIGEDLILFKLAKFISEEVPQVKDIQVQQPRENITVADFEKCKYRSSNVTVV